MLDLKKEKYIREPGHKILVVDQLEMIQQKILDMLKHQENMHVQPCTSIASLFSLIEEYEPTTILLGEISDAPIDFNLIEALQQNANTSAIPIVVMTTKDSPENKSESFAKGGSDFIIKFPDLPELLARLRYHSRSFIIKRQRDEAYRALRVSQQQLLDTGLVLQRMAHDLEKSNKALQIQVNLDGLTGIANRLALDNYLSEYWGNPEHRDSEISILMIDIDHFKKYNDYYGHVQGDQALTSVARTIASLVSLTSNFAARYGGEEFCIVLINTNSSSAFDMANKLIAEINSLRIPHIHPLEDSIVTLSIGISTGTSGSFETPTLLVQKADNALYTAKKAGRNRAKNWDSNSEDV